MEKLLSIIIPVYNAEQYISMTLDSCLNQNVDPSAYEILLINDGSTDNSLAILEDYAAKNKNIRLYTQPNGGVSVARNKGIDLACGKYIWFVDSDDLIANNSLQPLFGAIHNYDADILNFDSKAQRTRDFFEADQPVEFETCEQEEHKLHFLTYDDTKWMQEVWRYWFKRELLIDNKLFFNTNSKYGEDTTFSFTATIYAQKCIRTNRIFYLYYKNTDSATAGINTDKRFVYIDSLIENARYFKDITKNKGNYWRNLGSLKANYLIYAVTCKIAKEGNLSFAKQKIKTMKELGVYPYNFLYGALKDNMSFKQRILTFFRLCFKFEWFLMFCVRFVSWKRKFINKN